MGLSRWLRAAAVALPAALTLPAAVGAQTAAPPAGAALAQVLQRAVVDGGFAGEVLVADAQRIVFERAVGLAQRAPDRPHRPGAAWRWASVSKQVAAVLALQQVDAGRLALDAPLSTVWPEFAAPGAATPTPRQLMQHLSGLPNPDETVIAADGMPGFYRRPAADARDGALRYCSGPPARAPGAAFDYNNCDTWVLSELMARVTGQPYTTLLARQISQPLGLKSLALDTGRPRAAAVAYDAAGLPVPQPQVATFGPAGALEGSARDLLAFDRALMAGRLLSPAARQALWTGEPRWGYAALGAWSFPAKLKGCSQPVQLVERRGDVGGIQVRNILAPERGVAVIVFTNNADFAFGEIWQGSGFSHDLLAAALCP